MSQQDFAATALWPRLGAGPTSPSARVAPPCLAWGCSFPLRPAGRGEETAFLSRLPLQPPSCSRPGGHRPAPRLPLFSRPGISQRKSYGLSNISTPAPMTGRCETRDVHMTCRFLSSEAWARSNSGTQVPRKWPRYERNEAKSSQEPATSAPAGAPGPWPCCRPGKYPHSVAAGSLTHSGLLPHPHRSTALTLSLTHTRAEALMVTSWRCESLSEVPPGGALKPPGFAQVLCIQTSTIQKIYNADVREISHKTGN